jgi:hypothetical protein
MKLGGWARLGVVATGLWLFLVSALVIFQLNAATSRTAGFLVRLVHGSSVDPAPYTINGSPISGITWDVAVVNYPVALVLLFFPLAVIWLGVPLLVFTSGWVRRGFRAEP